MNIAEFFVSLGIKGAEGAVNSVKSVTDGMSDLWSKSTTAKVAIVGAFYELEQMFSASNKTGAELANFGTLTGNSTRKVQEYNAAIQLATGVQRDMNTTLATFTDLQDKINDIRFNKGGIVGHLQMMFSALGMQAPNPKELLRWAGNVDMLIQHMRDFADTARNRHMEPGMIRKVLEGITGDEGLITSLMKGGLSPAKLAATAPLTLSDNYINRTQSGAEAWAKIHLEMAKAMGVFAAVDGQKLANNIEPLIGEISRLAQTLVDLADKVKVFKVIGLVLSGWDQVLSSINSNLDRMDKSSDKSAELKRIIAENKNAQDWVLHQLHSPYRKHLTPEQGGPVKEMANLVKEYNTQVHIHTPTHDPKKHGELAARSFNDTVTAAQAN